MSRFFVEKSAVDKKSGTIAITGEDVKHIRSVLRSMPGDSLELSDGAGTDFEVTIESIEKESILARITGERPNRTEPSVDITLFQGVPKADKMDFIIQKCVELGVNRIVPVMTARTVVKFDSAKDSAAKAARWQRIALEAAKQCDRGIVPQVDEPVRFAEALKRAGSCRLRLLPYEEETEGGLRGQLEKFKAGNPALKIAVFIGPEGGFTAEEVAKAVKDGFVSVTLGPRILRTETAGIAVVSIIGYELGDMSGAADRTETK
jgi:16S rRNA (uracil1498-N3)-methyltransferase